MKKTIILTLCIIIQACAVGSQNRPDSYYTSNNSNTNTASIMSESLIGDNDKHINDLLLHRIKLPSQNRIAILKLSNNQWENYSSRFSELNESMVIKLVQKLRSSERVYDASFLPAMLIQKKPTLQVLREASAHFQADLLLAYSSQCNSYQKYRFVAANETKAYCSVEAILLDVRSGIIAKSVVSTQNFSAKADKNDNDFSETIKKSELEAIATALGEVAIEVNLFLDSASTIAPNI